MSNEEHAVLEFFAQSENLPLALSVADLVDGIRRRMNNAFWVALRERIERLLQQHALPWTVEMTEDRNATECLVGLHLMPHPQQPVFLRLMMEQQFMGDAFRIYYGVMWSGPGGEKAQRAEVQALGQALNGEGFKNNETFLAWNWTPYHPRRRDFLERYADDPDALLDDAARLLGDLLLTHGAALAAANAALRDAPSGASVSLDSLRASLSKGTSA